MLARIRSELGVNGPQVLFDLGVVSTAEPFQRLVSQGMILGEVEFTAHRDAASGAWVAEDAPGAEPVRCGGEKMSEHRQQT